MARKVYSSGGGSGSNGSGGGTDSVARGLAIAALASSSGVDYRNLKNKPKVNGVELDGNMSIENLSLGDNKTLKIQKHIDSEGNETQNLYVPIDGDTIDFDSNGNLSAYLVDNAYSSNKKLGNYLYELTYTDIDEGFAREYLSYPAAYVAPSACSAFKKDKLVGRTFD